MPIISVHGLWQILAAIKEKLRTAEERELDRARAEREMAESVLATANAEATRASTRIREIQAYADAISSIAQDEKIRLDNLRAAVELAAQAGLPRRDIKEILSPVFRTQLLEMVQDLQTLRKLRERGTIVDARMLVGSELQSSDVIAASHLKADDLADLDPIEND